MLDSTTSTTDANSATFPPKTAKAKKTRARKTSTKPTRIYSYRILPPEDPEHRRLVDEQFWLAHQYRCRLTEIEIELRGRFREIDLDHPLTREATSHWEALSTALDEAFAALRAAKAGRAPEHRDDEQIKLRIGVLKIACTKAWRDVKAARALPEVRDHHRPRYTAAREAAAEQRLAARAAFSARGLMHGTYICIERAVERSVDSTGRPPEFKRYEGEGSIGRQLPRERSKADRLAGRPCDSVTANDLYSMADNRVRMTRLPDGWEQLPRTARRRVAKPYRGRAKRQRHGDDWQEIPARLDGQYLEMQFGWGPAKRPSTWIRFPLTHHRRMPEDAEILWVYVHRWRIGIHYEWRVQLSIESDTFHRPQVPIAAGGTCAIDIGWRRIFDAAGTQVGLRVAYLVDEHGQEREIRAPDGLWQRLAKVYSIAQIRSRELDSARDRLVAWVGDRQMPPWFTDRARGLSSWRSPRKLQRLVDTWQREENRFGDDGARLASLQDDDEILAVLQAWAKQDRHLGSWEAHMRDRTIAHRREVWRQVAAELAHTYQTILVEDGLCQSKNRERQMKIVDIEGWDKLPPEEGDPHEGREQRRQSRMAAPGELRLAIAQASHKTATTVVDVSRGKKSTRECAWCGHCQEHVDFAPSIEVQCEGCGRAWDQDANAARNLLHRRGLSSGPVPPAPASGPVPMVDGRALARGKRRKQRGDASGGPRRDVGGTSV
jgi:Putative transposase DNA-binding domain